MEKAHCSKLSDSNGGFGFQRWKEHTFLTTPFILFKAVIFYCSYYRNSIAFSNTFFSVPQFISERKFKIINSYLVIF